MCCGGRVDIWCQQLSSQHDSGVSGTVARSTKPCKPQVDDGFISSIFLYIVMDEVLPDVGVLCSNARTADQPFSIANKAGIKLLTSERLLLSLLPENLIVVQHR
jgi:hypothetical protein